MNNQRTVFFWNPRLDYQMEGSHMASGIEIQMSRWAKVFSNKGWKVYSITEKESFYSIDKINFIPQKHNRMLSRLHLAIIQEFFFTYLTLKRINPDLVLLRGANRYLYILHRVCKMLKIKLCFFGASDVNFIPGKDIINSSSRNTKLYRRALGRINYIVTQNDSQYEKLLENYGKQSIIIPNIWIDSITSRIQDKEFDVIWVSNLRPLKRAEWVIELANRKPNINILMVGGAVDKEYYRLIERQSKGVENLTFMGPMKEVEVNELISRSKILLCTSEYEGFPNTFLQAWAKSVPVISTVDPSGVITNNKLGIVGDCFDDIYTSINQLLNDSDMYNGYCESIYNYFRNIYDSNKQYSILIDYLKLKEI